VDCGLEGLGNGERGTGNGERAQAAVETIGRAQSGEEKPSKAAAPLSRGGVRGAALVPWGAGKPVIRAPPVCRWKCYEPPKRNFVSSSGSVSSRLSSCPGLTHPGAATSL